MNNTAKIEYGSIILSYSFIYNQEKVKKCKDTLPKVENLLSYVDSLFKNNKIHKYDKQKVYLYQNEKIYTLSIEKMEIIFFEDSVDIATLYIKLVPDNVDLKELYHINRALSRFYSKEAKDRFIYLGSDPRNIKLSLEEFKSNIQELIELDETLVQTLLESIETKEIPKNKIIFKDENIELKKIVTSNGVSLDFKTIKESKFTKAFCKLNYTFYNPHETKIKKKCCYPFNGDNQGFPGRVGFDKDEYQEICSNNSVCDQEHNRNYLYFNKQKEIAQKLRKEQGIYEFIHYDTFITSLITEYVKPNEGFMYYDTFNPTGTSYINSYITLSCDSKTLNDEYDKNFISFEPLISSKVVVGNTIKRDDFFKTYQSQADMFTLGNSHNIVHIVDTKAKDIISRKENVHFYVYLLTVVQRNFILNIITSSIINIKDVETKNIRIKDIFHSYKKLSATLDNFNTFLTNYNFKVISNSSSVDNSYEFFRECNEIDKLSSQWGTVSSKFKDWKSVLAHILRRNPALLFGGVFIIGLLLQLVTSGMNTLISLIN